MIYYNVKKDTKHKGTIHCTYKSLGRSLMQGLYHTHNGIQRILR